MFLDLLQKVSTHVEGVQGCLLLDRDAVSIAEQVLPAHAEMLSSLAVELTHALRLLARNGALEQTGPCHEFLFRMQHVTALGMSLQGEHVLLVALEAGADIERARRMLTLLCPWVERLL
ncbi:MAG: hypothetical protein RBU37_21960 [Myxococcota bacterium]|nr:hypothetical protein [Myxococcota bacterium]